MFGVLSLSLGGLALAMVVHSILGTLLQGKRSEGINRRSGGCVGLTVWGVVVIWSE